MKDVFLFQSSELYDFHFNNLPLPYQWNTRQIDQQNNENISGDDDSSGGDDDDDDDDDDEED